MLPHTQTEIIENKLAATVAPMHPAFPECDMVNFFGKTVYRLINSCNTFQYSLNALTKISSDVFTDDRLYREITHTSISWYIGTSHSGVDLGNLLFTLKLLLWDFFLS